MRVYRQCLYCKDGKPILTRLYSRNNQFNQITLHKLFPDQFSNMHGHEIRVVAMSYGPMIKVGPPIEPGSTRVQLLDSMNTRILTSLADVLNFTYSVHLPADSEWGQQLPDGRFSGAIGTLQREEADTSFTLTYMLSRSRVIDFMQVFYDDPLVILTAKPLPLSPILSFVRPFSYEVYIALICLVLLSTFLFWCSQTLQSRWFETKKSTLFKSFHLALGILIEEIPPAKPKQGGASVLLITWIFSCLILTTLYKSTLRANFIIPKMSDPITSLEDLVQHNWTWGVDPYFGAVYQWTRTADNPTVKSIFKGNEVLPFEEHVKKIMTGNHAFIWLKTYINYRVAKEYSDIFGNHPFYIAHANEYSLGGMAWGTRKGSPFGSRFSDMIQWLFATGHAEHWIKVIKDEAFRKARMKKRDQAHLTKHKLYNVSENETALSLDHLQGTFYILLVGSMLSLLSLLLEKLVWKYKNSAQPHENSIASVRTNEFTDDGDCKKYLASAFSTRTRLSSAVPVILDAKCQYNINDNGVIEDFMAAADLRVSPPGENISDSRALDDTGNGDFSHNSHTTSSTGIRISSTVDDISGASCQSILTEDDCYDDIEQLFAVA